MMHDGFSGDVVGLADAELLSRLQGLVRADRALSVDLLVHLGEVDARGLFRAQAAGSMFEYAVTVLRMSEAEAYLRIQAARIGRRLPWVLELFGRGELNLTAIKLLAPHLTSDNHVALLERARGKTKREIELLVAEISPRPDVVARMRKLPCRIAEAVALVRNERGLPSAVSSVDPPVACVTPQPLAADGSSSMSLSHEPAQPAVAGEHSPRVRSSCKPLRPGRFKLELTIGQAAHDKLEELRDLLRHQVPDGDLASLFERAVDALLERTMKRRFAQLSGPRNDKAVARVRNPRTARGTAEGSGARDGTAKVQSRYVPRSVVRAVHARDGGRCSFVSADGQRCCARGFLELHHHDQPFARGGRASVENLRLMCRAHNAWLAEQDFGRDFMRAKARRSRDSVQNERAAALSGSFSQARPSA